MMKKFSIALGVLMVPSIALAGPFEDALTAAVDFTDILAMLAAVGALALGITLAIKGFKVVRRMISAG